MAVDIGPKIGLDGESEFRKQLQNVNQSLKTLGSEMKLVTAEFAANADSEEALTKKNDVLERSVSTLRDKLELQQKALQESAQKFGEADARTMKWQQAVNETEAALATAENQIKQNTNAIDKLGDETEETGAEFKNAGKEAASFGDVLKANVLGDLIIKGVEALATGVKKLGKAFKDAIVDGAAYADEISSMSAKTGLSTDTLQEFKYMADLVDVDLNTITGALSKLTKNMNSARKGTGDTAAAFEMLGVNITNADGSLRDNEEVFNDALEALGNVANETERDALAMQIFGKSAQELNPLIVAGADTIAQYAQEAHDMGYVLDSEALESLNNVQDSFDRLHAATDGVKNQLAQALAPTIEEVAGKLQNWIAGVNWEDVGEKINKVADGIKTFFSFVSENGDTIIAILAGIAAGFVAWNVTEMVMGLVGAIKAFQTANEGATIAQAALNAVMNANPIGIIITALSALVAAIIVLWNTNEDFRNWVLQAWEDVKNWIKKAVDDVVNWITQAWEDIKSFFKNAPKWFKDIGRNIVEGLWNGIKNATQWLIGKITGWFNDVVGAVKKFLKIGSPSKVFEDEIGVQMAAGVGVGWEKEFDSVARDINGSMESLLPDSTANIGVVSSMRGTGVRSAMADSVNAIGSLMGGNTGNLTIQFVVNGREFSRAILPDFRLVQAQNPIIVNDF